MKKWRPQGVWIAVIFICFVIAAIVTVMSFSGKEEGAKSTKKQAEKINEILNQKFPQISDSENGKKIEDKTAAAKLLDKSVKHQTSDTASKKEVESDSFVGELPDDFLEHISENALLQLASLSNLPTPTDGATQLVSHIDKAGLKQPEISPDGKYAIFRLPEEDVSLSNIYLYSLENKTYHNLTESIAGPRPWNATFSPDGKRILINGFPHSGLWLVDISEGLPGKSSLLLDNPDILMLDWASDGKILTYTEVVGNYGSRIILFDIEKKSVLRVIGGNSNRYDKVEASHFSPDGNNLVYVKKKKVHNKWTGQLIIENLQTGTTKVLAERPSQNAFKTPIFSPDGKKIAFGSNMAKNTEIYTLDISDDTIKRITYGGGTDPSWLSNETIVFGSQRTTGISSIYTIDVNE